jgi:predicted ATP-grasp superfamily ATP-dependent carboligase
MLLVASSVTTLVLAASTVRLAVQEPLIVERGCFTTAAKVASSKRTNEEIEAFVRQALPRRFDTKSAEAQLVLSPEEHGFRIKEQQELKARGITQRVVVNEVAIVGAAVTVDADRILTAGTLRSAVAFPVTLELAQTDRTAANPYGLVMTRVSQTKSKEESK